MERQFLLSLVKAFISDKQMPTLKELLEGSPVKERTQTPSFG